MMKTKLHQTYRDSQGNIVVGATTAIGVLNKPALLPWVERLTKEGIDWRKYRDESADIGTLAHAMILDKFMGWDTDTSDYSANQIAAAQQSVKSFDEWAKGKEIIPILIEGQLVSDFYRYGGTVDFYGIIDGVYTLLDLKTGKGVYPEFTYQAAAYEHLLIWNNFKVDEVRCLNIPRTNDESFVDKKYSGDELIYGFDIFEACLIIYYSKKHLKHK